VKGAVAAGHPLTAEAGARILSEGGNAVDACVAATLVSWVAESTLTGPGGGGYLLARNASDRTVRVFDFFVAAPGIGFEGAAAPMPSVDIWFDASNGIPYLVGAPSCAVPGVVAGLSEGHRRLGRLPWAELFSPAIELARAGVPISNEQARLHTLLDPILRLEPEGRRLYGPSRPLGVGEEPDLSDLATALEILARDGADAFYRGELAHAMLACVRTGGGRLTADDLASYRAIVRRPIRAAFRDTEFMTCPPSSAGGVLIAFALRVLDRLGPPAPAGSADEISRLAEVMREATRARGGSFVRELSRGGLPARLLDPANVAAAARRAAKRGPAASESLGLPSTTHVSVVDADGNVASLSASTGAGSGVIVPGTGIHLNNMLGESDLLALATTVGPGRRLASMMAPSLVLRGDEPRLVVGSAGSARLRSAIMQTIVNVIDHGQDVREALAAPRVHLEEHLLNVEEGIDPAELDELERRGYDVARWAPGNVFFGGVSAVTVSDDGQLAAAGDPRRGGAGAVVA
jgi:gamma-glutamyltranspeptidase/glutathione hydrolase